MTDVLLALVTELNILIFQTFFNSPVMSSVLDSFCLFHIHAPGQEPRAQDLPDDFNYPSMEELSEQASQSAEKYR